MPSDPIEASRSVFTAFGGWKGELRYICTAFLGSLLVAGLVALLAVRGVPRAGHAHWTERARLAYPGRQATMLTLLLLPAMYGALGMMYEGRPPRMPVGMLEALGALAAFLPASVARVWAVNRLLDAPLNAGDRARATAVLILIWWPAPIVAITAAFLGPARLDLWSLPFFAGAAIVLAWSMAGAGLPLAAALRLARPAGVRLGAVVAAASERVGVRPRSVLELASPLATTRSLPAAGVIMFTDGALAALKDEDLVVLAATQLVYLSGPRQARHFSWTGLLVLLTVAGVKPIVGTFGPWGLAAILVVGILYWFTWASAVRRAVVHFDAVARAHEGEKGTYARALERCYEANLMPSVIGSWRAVHPELYDRMVAAGVEPSFPRPKPPDGRLVAATYMLVALLALVSTPTRRLSPAPHPAPAPDPVASSRSMTTVTGVSH